jgi:hypothetical protein
MTLLRVVVTAAVAAGAVCACGGDDSNVLRGRGLSEASVSPADQAHIYEAAARSAFDVDNTSLLLDRRLLPRTIGLAESGKIGEAAAAELRRRNTVKGLCEPALTGVRGAPRCKTEFPGYILRFSPVLGIKPDSVQIYLFAQKYDTPGSGNSEPLRFERAYQVVRRGTGWLAVLEGRVSKEVRGEGR